MITLFSKEGQKATRNLHNFIIQKQSNVHFTINKTTLEKCFTL